MNRLAFYKQSDGFSYFRKQERKRREPRGIGHVSPVSLPHERREFTSSSFPLPGRVLSFEKIIMTGLFQGMSEGKQIFRMCFGKQMRNLDQRVELPTDRLSVNRT